MLRKTAIQAIALALLLAPATLACQTDDGLFDRQEGPFEEAAEEVDDALDR